MRHRSDHPRSFAHDCRDPPGRAASPERAYWLIFGLGILLRAYVSAICPRFVAVTIYRDVGMARFRPRYQSLPLVSRIMRGLNLSFLCVMENPLSPRQPGRIFAVTIYPPLAQFFFLIVTRR